MLIRDAGQEDLPGILKIYNDAVANTTAIWNDQPVDLDNRRAWLSERQRQHFPVTVALDDDGRVLGYASYGPWRAFDGYRFTVEHSVYVRNGRQNQGIGRALLEDLIKRAREADLHVLVGAIESTNHASLHLHERLGFVQVGQLPEVGRKFDRWLDLTLVQLTLLPVRSADDSR